MSAADRHSQTIRIRVAQSSLEQTGHALKRGPERGLRQAQRLIESEIQQLPRQDRGPLSCRAGCDFCCHLRVMATPVEVFTLLDYLERSLDPEAFTAFTGRLRDADRQLRELRPERVLTTNLPCPVLADGLCAGYAARPLNCRSYHSTSVDACEASFNHPEDLDRGHPQITALARVHEGGQAGFVAAFGQAGYDNRQYELVTALAEAIADSEARKRFERGERAFLRVLEIQDP